MDLNILPHRLTVCKVTDPGEIDWQAKFYFVGRTDEELSLVCRTEDVPGSAVEREDGWRGFRIVGTLDFSLTGILSRLSGILAVNGIGIFAVSTYNTDYVLVKEENLGRTKTVLEGAGYRFV